MTDVSIKTQQVSIQPASKGCDTPVSNKALLSMNTNDNVIPESECKKRDVKDIESALKLLISGTALTLQDAKDILNYCGYDEQELENADNAKFTQILRFFMFGLKNIPSGKDNIDKKELAMTMLTYKIAVIDKGLGEESAQAFVDKYKEMDLLDILHEKIPSLKGKEIKDITAQELKEIFKAMINKSLAAKQKRNPEAFMDLFMGAIGKCDDKEKAKIFHAFALLLKDEDMKNIIPDIYKKMVATYGNIDELTKLINKIGPKLLRELGFDDETIKILNFESMKDLSPEQMKAIIDSFIQAFEGIDEQDLPILKKVLTSITNNQIDNLSQEELNVLTKYKTLIDNTVNVIAINAQRPELKIQLAEHYKNLFSKLKNIGISDEIFRYTKLWFEQNPNLFDGMDLNDFIKKINEISDNKFSEAIGDTNPENLCQKNNSDESSESNFGLTQRVSAEAFSQSAENIPTLRAQFVEEKEESLIIEKQGNKANENDNRTSIIKSQAIINLEAFNYALAQGFIKIDDAGKEFNKACKSVQLKVISYLQIHKNNRLDLINSWHNSNLASVAANKFNFNSKQIDELVVSIGRKQVMKNNYVQKHKNDKKEKV